MSCPLVSVSGVWESETVQTTQRTERGACALCSVTGERAGGSSGRSLASVTARAPR